MQLIYTATWDVEPDDAGAELNIYGYTAGVYLTFSGLFTWWAAVVIDGDEELDRGKVDSLAAGQAAAEAAIMADHAARYGSKVEA
ncbi:hypothetical protein ACWIGI_28660 [Nocardia sp. NPDC055321]